LIIYTDGQTLIKDRLIDYPHWFQEVWLTPDEMCGMRSKVQKTGFFDVKPDLLEPESHENPIYKVDKYAEASMGASDEIIQFNGEISQTVYIYTPLIKYLIPSIRQTRNIVSGYIPEKPTKKYVPERALLWLEKGRGYAPEYLKPIVWPSNLPKLADLYTERIETYDGEFVFLEGMLKQQMLDLFQYRMSEKLFLEGNQVYNLILRPLLPHETVNNISPWPEADIQVNLPFNCK
jgi:hypothetical protein